MIKKIINHREEIENLKLNSKPNEVLIKFFTAGYCPPCKKTKSFLFGEDESKREKHLNDLIQKTIFKNRKSFYDLFMDLRSNFSPEKKQFFLEIGKKSIHNFYEKKSEDLLIINIIMQIKEKKLDQIMDLNLIDDENHCFEVSYIGFIKNLIENFSISIFLINVEDEDNQEEVIKYKIRSIPSLFIEYFPSGKLLCRSQSILNDEDFLQVLILLYKSCF